MFIHIFGFRWKPEATEAEKSRAAAEILAFRHTIPGLLEAHYGDNFSPRGQGYETVGHMHFTDRAAYEAYAVHPLHQALLDWLLPLIDAVELDLEA